MKKYFIIGFIVFVMLFAGCGGAPREEVIDNTVSQPTEETSAQQTVTTAAGTKTTAAAASKTNELFNLFRNRPKAYTVTYNVRTKVQDEKEYIQDMTQYFKDENTIRMDTVVEDEGKKSEARMYFINNDFITCSKNTGNWECMKFSGGEDKNPEEAMEEMEENIKTSDVTRIADRVIAGVNTKCYKLSMIITNTQNPEVADRLEEMQLDSWEATYCISEDGVPLYSESTSKNMYSIMEAKSYKRGVSDSDFVPPATPKDLSEMMKGMGSAQAMDDSEPPQDMPSEEEMRRMMEESMGEE